MRLNLSVCALSVLLLGLAACATEPPSPRPDTTLRVVPTAKGLKAEAPPCPHWSDNELDAFSNQPLPQFGCATRQNLAAMVARPEDLVKARPEGLPNPEITGAAMDRYITDKTRPLADPHAVAPTATNNGAAGGVTGAMMGGLTGGK